MKILMVFIDMLSAMNQGVCNKNVRWNSLDDTLSSIGGNVYTRCCSPAPDTPRSTACIWTGLLPQKNGCDTRMKYSKYYLNENIDSIWKMFQRKKMAMNIYTPKEDLKLGVLPQYVEDNVQIVKDDDLEGFLNSVNVADNSLTYICLDDYHTMQSYIKHDTELVDNVYDLVKIELEMIFSKLKKDIFDIIVIFSDHGYLPQGSPKEIYYDTRRTQIYLQLYIKGMKGIKQCDELCSCMDIFPTLAFLMKEPIGNQIDGLNLFENKKHPYLTLEDYTSFDHPLGQIFGLWGVRYEDKFIITDGLDKWKKVEGGEMLDVEEIEECKKILSEKTQYKEMNKALEIDAMYKTGGTARSTFSTGQEFVPNWYKFKKVQDFAFIGKVEIPHGSNGILETNEKISIASSRSDYNYFRYDLRRLKRYSIHIANITGDSKEFSVCVYDFANNKVLHYEQCYTKDEYVFDFIVGEHCEKQAFLIYAGLMGKTTNKNMTVNEFKVITSDLV